MMDKVGTLPETVYENGGDEYKAVKQLVDTVERFMDYRGPIHRSPLFGNLTKEEVSELQLVHFAHHLSWLNPN